MAWGRKQPGPDPRPQQGDENEPPTQAPEAAQDHGDGSGGGAGSPARAAEEQIARLLAERDELNQKLLRTLADYQNSQRRAVREQEEARRQGITSVALSALKVLDHFDLALMQDPAKATAEQIIQGVRVIRDELLKVLQSYGVQDISPLPGDEFDPHKHEAVMQTETDAVPTGHIVATLQPGFTLGERIIRPARVSIRAARPGATDLPPAK
jgi:molecular chaperone GrpE